MSVKSHILGLHQSGPITSAAVIADGAVQAAAAQERFSRIKQDSGFPLDAARFCLNRIGCDLEGIGHVAIGWNPGENVALKYRGGFSDWMRYPGEWLASVPNQLLPRAGFVPDSTTMTFTNPQGRRVGIDFVDHHLCHARLAYETCGQAEAAILVVDGWSEQKTVSMFHGRGNGLTVLQTEVFPHSLGCFYAAMTDYLGYRPFSDEWRVMGMAAYGQAEAVPELDKLIILAADGRFELDLSYFDFYNFDRPGFFSSKLERLLGPARKARDELLPRHFHVAAAAQALFGRVMDHMLGHLHDLTGCQDVCLSGGAAMNCLYNGAVTSRTPFRRCHISFAPDDSGNSLGAALEVARRHGVAVDARGLDSALGPSFDDESIAAALDAYKQPHRRLSDPARETAALLAQGLVVGWVQGRAEFGQRALGRRSILASPLDARMKDRINAAVKFRESYRPFAPVLPQEDVGRYFSHPEGGAVRFMEKALRFLPGAKAAIPAVVHQDGTGRLQTVDAERMPALHDLLREFESLTGHPVLINTSFNLNGEPMVNSPEDALRTFHTCGMDALVLGNFLLTKVPA